MRLNSPSSCRSCICAARLSPSTLRCPTFWQVSTESEFLRGEVENLAIDSFGRLTLGPTSATVYDASAPFLWTVVSGPDGSLYAGSGNEGQVYRIDSSGSGAVFFDTEELEVHAIAPAPGGGIYVGTSPDGKIYKVDATGKGAVFFDPGDRYIWSLAVDRAGNVFAATGDKGVIYKITPDGKGTPFYADQGHARDDAGLRSRGPAARRHRIARPRVPHRRVGQAVRAARLELQRDPHAPRGRERQHLRRRGERTRRRPPIARCAVGARAADAGADAERLDRDHRRRHRRHRRCRRHSRRRAAPARSGPAAGALFRILPGRRIGSDLGIARGSAVRRGVRARRHAARRHRQQGQDLPPVRRSAAAHAGRSRQRAAGHEPAAASARAACSSRRRIPDGCSGCRRRAPIAAPTPPTCATRRPSRRGARSSGRKGPAAAASRSPRGRATRARRTKRGATGAPPYTDRDGSPITQSARPLSAVARRAHRRRAASRRC